MMISRLQSEYTGRVAEIWLEGNLNAHCFIPAQYWRDNFELVKELLGQAEVYVYEDARQIQGFIGLNDEYTGFCEKQNSKAKLKCVSKEHTGDPFLSAGRLCDPV